MSYVCVITHLKSPDIRKITNEGEVRYDAKLCGAESKACRAAYRLMTPFWRTTCL